MDPIVWTTPTPTETGPTNDPAAELSPDFFVQSTDGGSKSLSGGKRIGQVISTPHFDGTLEEIFIGKRLNEQTASQIRQLGEVRAPQGYDIVAFTLKAGRPSFASDGERRSNVQLRAGDSVIRVEAPFGRFVQASNRYELQWVMFGVCVPEGRDAFLDVEDQGKTVTVDIRTGQPVLDDAWTATEGFRNRWDIDVSPGNAVFTRQMQTLPPAGIQQQSAKFSLAMEPDTSWGLVPWNPEGGWAEAGHQWLLIKFGARIGFDPASPYFVLNIDVPASFTYQDKEGLIQPAVMPKSITTEALIREQGELDVTWQVTGRDDQAIIRCAPMGQISASYQDLQNLPAEFSSPVAPVEFVISFKERPRN